MIRFLNIHKLFFLLFLQGFWTVLAAQTAQLKEAEAAYTQEAYDKAIESYESVLKSNGPSAGVLYNLGNAYYKSDRLASAILNYERALLQAPNDADIRFNLEMAKQRTVDKIEPIGTFFLTKWFQSIQNLATVDTWAYVAVICFLFTIIGITFYFFSKRLLFKKTGFFLSAFFLVCVVLANVFASKQKAKMMDRSGAIVFAETVTVKSSPDDSGTDLFVLHEGTKVNIKSSLGEWSEIILEDGNQGWMPTKAIETIN